MNGFARHGLDHTSPSQINLWANAPDVWIAEKLFGRKGPRSAAAARGVAVEEGVAAILRGADMAKGVQIAEAVFATSTALKPGADRDKERAALAPMVENAAAFLSTADLGPAEWPESGQHRVEIACAGDGWRLPVIGYLDFRFPGDVVDLKTTHRMPSEMSREHQRQRAIYAATAGNKRVRFLYVTPKKAEWREDGETQDVLAEIKTILNRQERFLRLGDADFLKSIVPVREGFYWSGNQEARRDLYGI